MNVSINWISEMLGQTVDPKDAAERLANAVAPVDAVEPIGDELADVIVALVQEVSQHPDADRLTVCRVDTGNGIVDVVCGAPNVTAGKKYPYASVGSVLPGDFKIKKLKIRGVESNGMLCSESEVDLGSEGGGLMELSVDSSPGTSLPEALKLRDTRLAIDVNPDRPDVLCHKGIARELGASLGINPRLCQIPGAPDDTKQPVRTGSTGEIAGVTVTIEDTEGCPRYMAAAVRGVEIGPSPVWLKSRMHSIGSRSINNVVDATNYILFELNQPLHAFDLDTLGGAVVIRNAQDGETLTTLDGELRELNAGMTMICDASKPIAVGGVMGDVGSEVTNSTTNILLECAYFEPKGIRATRTALKLTTDASYRFERGTDLQGMPDALRRAVSLIIAVAGGEEAEAPIDLYPNPIGHANVFLRPARVEHLLGVEIPIQEIEDYLTSVGFAVAPKDDRLAVQVPGWRPDVTREVDLIEEVARLRGYNSFPTEMRPFRPGTVPNDGIEILKARVRTALTANGLHEVRSVSFSRTPGPDAQPILNPLSADEAFLRTDLMTGLARSVEYNWSVRERNVRLFEIGTVFRRVGKDVRPAEQFHVAGVVTGARKATHWSNSSADNDYDLWDLKFLLEETVAVCGVGNIGENESGWAVTGEDGGRLGWAMEVVCDRPEWVARVFGFEVELTLGESTVRKFRTLPNTPPVERDLALVIPDGVDVAETETVMQEAAGPFLESVVIFDEYRTEGIGGRSVAWHLIFRAPGKTLRDRDADHAVKRIVETLEKKLDVRLRQA
ncbi:MAG: phenylalanine--tRNA ligase subunit beta [Gemmatimonadetes bacterium]|nr:phenylalanine--tRNA ligase subunit beta [Gemmatimonadota bacterium]